MSDFITKCIRLDDCDYPQEATDFVFPHFLELQKDADEFESPRHKEFRITQETECIQQGIMHTFEYPDKGKDLDETSLNKEFFNARLTATQIVEAEIWAYLDILPENLEEKIEREAVGYLSDPFKTDVNNLTDAYNKNYSAELRKTIIGLTSLVCSMLIGMSSSGKLNDPDPLVYESAFFFILSLVLGLLASFDYSQKKIKSRVLKLIQEDSDKHLSSQNEDLHKNIMKSYDNNPPVAISVMEENLRQAKREAGELTTKPAIIDYVQKKIANVMSKTKNIPKAI